MFMFNLYDRIAIHIISYFNHILQLTLLRAHTLTASQYFFFSNCLANRTFCWNVPENSHGCCDEYAMVPFVKHSPLWSGSSPRRAINMDDCKELQVQR